MPGWVTAKIGILAAYPGMGGVYWASDGKPLLLLSRARLCYATTVAPTECYGIARTAARSHPLSPARVNRGASSYQQRLCVGAGVIACSHPGNESPEFLCLLSGACLLQEFFVGMRRHGTTWGLSSRLVC